MSQITSVDAIWAQVTGIQDAIDAIDGLSDVEPERELLLVLSPDIISRIKVGSEIFRMGPKDIKHVRTVGQNGFNLEDDPTQNWFFFVDYGRTWRTAT